MLAGNQRKLGVRAIAIGAAQAVLWTVLSAALTVASFSVERTFTRFNVNLPDATRTVLDFAYFLHQFWYLGLAAAFCWPLLTWGVVLLLSSDGEAFILRRLWYLATWIVPVVAVIFALAALMVSLMALHHRFS